jgi:NodT family efflux transporter outer membrane factor (OMF) lipoprotein
MKRPLAIMALLAIITAGCSPYGTGRFNEHLRIPAINSSSAEGANLYGNTGRWWEAFEDPALDSLMERAFRENLDLAQAYARMEQARAAAREAGAKRLPSLTANAAAGRVRQVTGAGPLETDSYQTSVGASYELDLWGKMRSKTRAAALESMAAEEALKAAYMGVSAEIAELYYTSVEQKAQLKLSGLTIESLDRIRQSVELRYRAGVVTALDLYLARQNLATASTRRPTLEVALETAEAGLALAIGNAPGEASIVTPDTLPEPPEFPTEIPSDILKRRPDVQAALRSLEAKDYRVAAAVADRFPSFSLTASYGGASGELGEILKSPNIFWNALVKLAMPIIDGGRRSAASDKARAAMRESLAAYRKAVLSALGDVHIALIRNQKSTERILLMEQAVRAGVNTLRVAEAQYLQGITDYINVLSAQQQLAASRSSLLTSRRQLISDRIQLARALGGNWMAEEAETARSEDKQEDKDNKAGNDDYR